MRRHLLALAVAGLFGSLLASDASACCHKKKVVCATPCAAPAPCAPAPCAPAPCPEPAPCAPVKKHCFGGFKLFKGGLCHKKQACAPVVYAAPCSAPVVYPTGQASPQS